MGLGENPKDRLGVLKVSLTKLPAVASVHAAHAMMDGAEKYGPYNWRKNKVFASIYVDAALRHLEAWYEGEENAPDSEAHHLGHAIACCGILLDAQETGNLVDDRPDGKGVLTRVLDRLGEIIRRRQAKAPLADIATTEDDVIRMVKRDRRIADMAMEVAEDNATVWINGPPTDEEDAGTLRQAAE